MTITIRMCATISLVTALVLAAAPAARAQGSLTPPGAPAPTMKSLQEIWDRLAAQEAAVHAASRQNSLILDALGVNLPWLHRDGPNGSGPLSLAFDPDGTPTVAYIEAFGAIKLARYDGSSWTTENVAPDYTGLYGISLAFGTDGRPAMAFQANVAGGSDIRYARYDGSAWQIEIVDARDASVDRPTLAFAPDGRPAVSHYAATSTNLVFSIRTGGVWSNVTVDAQGYYNSLAFGPDGQPAIAYTRSGEGLFLTRFDGTTWTATNVDSHSWSSSGCSLAFGPDGRPAIAYIIYGLELRYEEFDGSAWSFVTLDTSSGSDYFIYPSLAFGPGGQPAVAYARYDSLANQHSVKFARRSSFWNVGTVDDNGDVGYHASLAFGPDGQPAIACNLYIPAGNQTTMQLFRKGTFTAVP